MVTYIEHRISDIGYRSIEGRALEYHARVQLRLPWFSPASAAPTRAPREVVAGGRSFPVVIARHRWARRYLIRVTEQGEVRLTVPRGASIAQGLQFAASQATWITTEWRRSVDRRSWGSGTVIWYRGAREMIDIDNAVVRLGSRPIGERIPGSHVRDCVQSHLRQEAVRELPERCRLLAIAHGLLPSRVSVRDQRSRWGACSAKGVITLNWRLVQMPLEVADYVMLHELAHLRQANHSRRFWREVARLCPDWQSSERWIRRHGRELL